MQTSTMKGQLSPQYVSCTTHQSKSQRTHWHKSCQIVYIVVQSTQRLLHKWPSTCTMLVPFTRTLVSIIDPSGLQMNSQHQQNSYGCSLGFWLLALGFRAHQNAQHPSRSQSTTLVITPTCSVFSIKYSVKSFQHTLICRQLHASFKQTRSLISVVQYTNQWLIIPDCQKFDRKLSIWLILG